jgi:phosphatidylserine synthase
MVKKILGTVTAISAFVWLAFFFNGVDRGQYFFIFLIAAIINILLIIKTKFWKEKSEQKTEIKIIRFLCVIVNIILIFILLKVMKSEFDLDDSDDIYLSILMFLSSLAPFVYLLKIKNDYR